MRPVFVLRIAVLVLALLAAAGGTASAVGNDMLQISPPGDQTLTATTPCGSTECAFVTYSFTVTGGTPPYNLVCNLNSGSFLTVGTHRIGCLAQDSRGNSTPEAFFTVTIDSPAPATTTTSTTTAATTSTNATTTTTASTTTSASTTTTGSPTTTTGSTTTTTTTASTGGNSYTPDVTGCTDSTCMGNSLSFFSINGVTCDFGSFAWSRLSYTCSGISTVTSPATLRVGNQTNDVSVSFAANGRNVPVASSSPTGQQSGISVSSQPIALVDGMNTLTATVDDPLARLAPMVYTWTFGYAAPASSAGGTPSATTTTLTTPGSATSRSPRSPVEAARPSSSGGATAAAPLVHASLAAPAIRRAATGSESLSFAVRLPRAGTVRGALVTTGRKTLLRFFERVPKGLTVFRKRLVTHRVARGTRLTLRLVIRTGRVTRVVSKTFRA